MKQSKSSYVRKLPRAMSAKDVVAKAKSDGIKLSTAQVYNIRSTSKAKPARATRADKPIAYVPAVPPTGFVDTIVTDIGAAEREFLASATKLGTIHAAKLLADMGAK